MTDEAYIHAPRAVKSDAPTQRPALAEHVLEVWRTRMAEGMDTLITEIGLRGVEAVLEREAEEKAGVKGRHDPARTARRYGYARTYVTFGGQKVALRRPRLRTLDNTREIPLASVSLLHDGQALQSGVLEVLLGVSQRAYGQTAQVLAPCARDAYGASKTTVGRRFRAALDGIVTEMRTRRIEEEILVLYIDGIGYGEHLVLVAMGMTGDGRKEILGLESGTTEDEAACRRLLENLIARGLSPESPRLYVLDGGKGLHAAVTHVFSDRAWVQRCAAHKMRNVLGKLPEAMRPEVHRAFARALAEPNGDKAEQRLAMLARTLDAQGQGKAAASLREGLAELVTVNRLGLSKEVRRRLRTTNPIESAFSQAGRQAERVRRWQNGRQVLRWVAFGLWRVQRAFQPLLNAAQAQELRAALDRHPRPQAQRIA